MELQIVICLSVCVCVSVDCHTDQVFGCFGQWLTQLMQLGCIVVIVSVGIIVPCVQHSSSHG